MLLHIVGYFPSGYICDKALKTRIIVKIPLINVTIVKKFEVKFLLATALMTVIARVNNEMVAIKS